ncbi:hypothetical protein BH20ACI3_BH20ACI3_34090 [soil metagenome]
MISARVRVFLALMIGIALLVVLVAFLQRRSGYYVPSKADPPPTPASASPPDSANPSPEPSSKPDPEIPSNPTAPPIGFVGTLKLVLPVAGVQPNQLLDTFTNSRSEGRMHDAIDIPAAQGTPVVAVADGQITKLFQSERGGITIYQLSTDQKLIFHYAHLQRYADGLSEGKAVRQGEVIGFVGDTGNATPGNYHLHFSIAVVSDPKRHWEGTNINPYPLLRN